MAMPPLSPESDPPRAIDARDVERALARGVQKNQRLHRALDTITREMERDPGAVARILRVWLYDPRPPETGPR